MATEFPKLYAAIENALGSESPKAPESTKRVDFYEVVQNIYDDVIEWPYWYESDETGNKGAPKKDIPPILGNAIRELLEDQFLPGYNPGLINALAQRVLSWNSWYWDTLQED
jgi:hypothetical protein